MSDFFSSLKEQVGESYLFNLELFKDFNSLSKKIDDSSSLEENVINEIIATDLTSAIKTNISVKNTNFSFFKRKIISNNLIIRNLKNPEIKKIILNRINFLFKGKKSFVIYLNRIKPQAVLDIKNILYSLGIKEFEKSIKISFFFSRNPVFLRKILFLMRSRGQKAFNTNISFLFNLLKNYSKPNIENLNENNALSFQNIPFFGGVCLISDRFNFSQSSATIGALNKNNILNLDNPEEFFSLINGEEDSIKEKNTNKNLFFAFIIVPSIGPSQEEEERKGGENKKAKYNLNFYLLPPLTNINNFALNKKISQGDSEKKYRIFKTKIYNIISFIIRFIFKTGINR